MTQVVSVVDLSHLAGPVRDQGRRPLCLAFSSSDLHLSGRACEQQLSAEYLAHECGLRGFDPTQGLTVPGVREALLSGGQPNSVRLPDAPSVIPYNHPSNGTPPFSPLYYCSVVEDPVVNFQAIANSLTRGKCVVIGARITDKFMDENIYLIGLGGKELGRHAMLCCGLGVCSSGSQVIRVKNSWGGAWGDSGYAWLEEGFVNANVEMVLTLQGTKDAPY